MLNSYDFLLYERVLNQKPKDKNKVYALHEPQVYCIAKGKDHKQYEYGNKVSIASTAKGNVIVGVVFSVDTNEYLAEMKPPVCFYADKPPIRIMTVPFLENSEVADLFSGLTT